MWEHCVGLYCVQTRHVLGWSVLYNQLWKHNGDHVFGILRRCGYGIFVWRHKPHWHRILLCSLFFLWICLGIKWDRGFIVHGGSISNNSIGRLRPEWIWFWMGLAGKSLCSEVLKELCVWILSAVSKAAVIYDATSISFIKVYAFYY